MGCTLGRTLTVDGVGSVIVQLINVVLRAYFSCDDDQIVNLNVLAFGFRHHSRFPHILGGYVVVRTICALLALSYKRW